MVKYTEEKVSKTLESIKQLLVLDEKQRKKLQEMEVSLIRISRAIKPNFWIDHNKWKKKPIKEKIEMLRKEKCVKFHTSGSLIQDAEDFPYIAFFQWEKDRTRLIKSGEIEK